MCKANACHQAILGLSFDLLPGGNKSGDQKETFPLLICWYGFNSKVFVNIFFLRHNKLVRLVCSTCQGAQPDHMSHNMVENI